MAEASNKGASGNVLTEPDQIGDVFTLGQEVVVQRSSTPDKKVAFLQGWKPGRYLVIDGLSSMVMSGALFQQNSMLVRFQSLGRVYGFSSVVLAVITDPALVILQWPDRLERVELTTENRLPVDLEVQVTLVEESDRESSPRPGRLRDLSQGGCQVVLAPDSYTKEKLAADSRLKLELLVKKEKFSFEVLVRNLRVSPSGMALGTRFAEGQEAAVNKLMQLVAPPLHLPD